MLADYSPHVHGHGHRVEEAAHAYVAKIKRDDPFCPEDEHEMEHGRTIPLADQSEMRVVSGGECPARLRGYQ